MALTGLQYQSMRLKFRGLLSTPFQFLSESELDSFIGQIAIDATGSVTAEQKSQADTMLARHLTSAEYSPTAADIEMFFTQAKVGAPLIVTALSPARYAQLKQILTGALSIAGVRSEAQLLGYLAPYFVVGPLAIMAGHIRCGYSGDVGLTSTTWQDQGPSGRHLAGTCSVAAAALGGKNCAQMNGTSHRLDATFSLPAPGTSPSYIWTIARNDSGGGFSCVVALGLTNDNALIRDSGATELCAVYPGFSSLRHALGFTVGTFKRARALFSNSSSDLVQVGAGAAVTGFAPPTNNAGDGIHLGFSNGTYSQTTYAEVWVFDQDPGGTNLAALDAWATTKYNTAFP